jgi:tetratricopeptide (TPR) repeat protein
MSGDATFTGTTYQGGAIAYVYVHILSQTRLGWLGDRVDDSPFGVSGEVGGPGDDARVELVTRNAFEVQAKHGLTAGKKLREIVDTVAASPDTTTDVVIVVDRGSSKTLYGRIARDLDRLRVGRVDGMGPDVSQLRSDGITDAVLRRIRIVAVDVDQADHPETKAALSLLRASLLSPEQAEAAWGVLRQDAEEVCARRGKRTRKEIVDLLEAKRIRVAPLARDAPAHSHLDFTKHLLERKHASAALVELDEIEKRITPLDVDPFVWYRLLAQRAAAFLQLNRYADSINAARKSLQYKPDGSNAMATWAAASMDAGDVVSALVHSNRAVEADPTDINAWGVDAQIRARAGQSIADAPTAVSSSAQYRTALAAIAYHQGEWPLLLERTSALLRSGVRTPEVLYFHAVAVSRQGGDGSKLTPEEAYDVKQLSDEAIEAIGDETHPLMVSFLVLRGQALNQLGEKDEAQESFARARQLDSDNLGALAASAQFASRNGNDAEAIALLRSRSIEGNSQLLSFRAKLLAIVGDTSARSDVVAALQNAADSTDPDLARLSAAEAALVIPDSDLAQNALALVGGRYRNDRRFYLFHGRLGFERGDIEAALRGYEAAAERDPAEAAEIHAELGSRLVEAERPSEAVAAFRRIPAGSIPSWAVKYFGRALVQTNDLVAAQEVIDEAANAGPLPSWALGLSVDIALRRDDSDSAILHLEEFVAKNQPHPDAHIELAKRLIEVGKSDAARAHVEGLYSRVGSLGIHQRMTVAQLLHAIKRDDLAIPLAFQTFREGATDPRLHRAFIMLALLSESEPTAPNVVGPDTRVELRGPNNERKGFSIFKSGPIDPIRSELSVEDARAAGLLGLRVGDTYSRAGHNDAWRVDRIDDVIAFAVTDAATHYAERFPREDFFVQAYSIGDGSSIASFAPLIRSLHGRKAAVENAFVLHRQQTLPLGFLAKVLGLTVNQIISHTISGEDRFTPLLIDWTDREGQEESKSAARDAHELTLTRSAVVTLHRLSLLDAVAHSYALHVPQSFVSELERDLRSARDRERKGRTYVASGDTGINVTAIPPGHATLLAEVEELTAILRLVRSNTTVHPRPLAKVYAAGMPQEEVRELIGAADIDAVHLAEHRRSTLYSDDLGLRKLLPKGSAGRSVSSAAMVGVLAERGMITTQARDGLLLQLILFNYSPIAVSEEILFRALQTAGDIPPSDVAKIFAQLSAPPATLGEAAMLVARVTKRVANSLIQLRAPSDVLSLGLHGMAHGWSPFLCAGAVKEALRNEFALLPGVLQQLESESLAFTQKALILESAHHLVEK